MKTGGLLLRPEVFQVDHFGHYYILTLTWYCRLVHLADSSSDIYPVLCKFTFLVHSFLCIQNQCHKQSVIIQIKKWATMLLSRHSVGAYQKMSSHATCQETFGHSCLSLLSHYKLTLA